MVHELFIWDLCSWPLYRGGLYSGVAVKRGSTVLQWQVSGKTACGTVHQMFEILFSMPSQCMISTRSKSSMLLNTGSTFRRRNEIRDGMVMSKDGQKGT